MSTELGSQEASAEHKSLSYEPIRRDPAASNLFESETMRRIARLTVAAALPLATLTTAARSQLAGVPVYYNPQGGAGLTLAAHAGFSSKDPGTGGTAYGIAGSFGTGPVTLSAMFGVRTASDWDAGQTSLGAALAYRVFGGGALPLAIAVQAGYGTVTSPPAFGNYTNYKITTIPVGLGIAFDPKFPLQPWIAPRIELASLTYLAGENDNATTLRVSAGLNVNVLRNLALHAAIDYGNRPAKLDPDPPTLRKSVNTFIFGFGVHINLHEAML